MTTSFASTKTAAALAVLACALTAAPGAQAQAHTQESGDYVLRASTVSAANLPDSMREKHGIPSGSGTAVLNVTVQQKVNGALRNVPARVEASARNLYGVETPLEMRQTVANGFVSYMGSYAFVPREVLDFKVTAHPDGGGPAIVLSFRDRLGRQ